MSGCVVCVCLAVCLPVCLRAGIPSRPHAGADVCGCLSDIPVTVASPRRQVAGGVIVTRARGHSRCAGDVCAVKQDTGPLEGHSDVIGDRVLSRCRRSLLRRQLAVLSRHAELSCRVTSSCPVASRRVVLSRHVELSCRVTLGCRVRHRTQSRCACKSRPPPCGEGEMEGGR